LERNGGDGAERNRHLIESQFGAGSVLAPWYNTPRGSVWDWSFLPGNNTPNNPADTDTGYIIEFVIDIADFNYAGTDTDITVGIKTSDKDGLPLTEEYWWPNSWAWVYQWSTGNYPPDYTVDHLLLQPASEVDSWTEY